jgi:inner membrane protein involved in colicin E2 resistance
MGKRLAAIVLVYTGCFMAWMILGGSVMFRSEVSDDEIKRRVTTLWGKEHRQRQPQVFYTQLETRVEKYWENGVEKEKQVQYSNQIAVPLSSSDVQVDVRYEPRQKGLFWYSTYTVSFTAEYELANTTDAKRFFFTRFYFPSAEAQYDDFRCTGPGGDIAYENQNGMIAFTTAELEPRAAYRFKVSYKSRGLDTWNYVFDPDDVAASGGNRVTEVKKLAFKMTTNFDAIDFPVGSMSPTSKKPTGGGYQLEWKFAKLITGLNIGLAMPEELNPGPLAGRITFFAPVSLLFFFFVLFVISVMRKVDLHPMHYFFLGASFFAFHLLFAYLVDHVDVDMAFAISAATSVFLVVTYMRVVVGWRFACVEAGLTQLLYLVAFSYTHFFQGYTGLIITALSIATLFAVMQITARVKWSEVFSKK